MRKVQTTVKSGLVTLFMLSLSVLLSCGGPPNSVVIGESDPDQSEHPSWFTDSFDKIARNFHNRVHTDDYLRCIYKFGVTRSGAIDSIELVQSSGNESFDLAGRRAFELSNPLPPLPDEFEDDHIFVTVPFQNR